MRVPPAFCPDSRTQSVLSTLPYTTYLYWSYDPNTSFTERYNTIIIFQVTFKPGNWTDRSLYLSLLALSFFHLLHNIDLAYCDNMLVSFYTFILYLSKNQYAVTRAPPYTKNPFGKPQAEVDFACVFNL